MAKKLDTTEVKFFVAIDENGVFGVDDDVESARDTVCGNTEGDCLDVYEVTITVPKARRKAVHLGAIKVADDGAGITVESVEVA
jgi:hypothetical protein